MYYYSLVTTGLKKNKGKMFTSRQLANEYMYNLCGKYKLNIVEVYDDKHDKTYICDNNIRFFIQRM